ncbi:hypothetical protein D3C76_1132590 [compost metagenome]
MRGFQDEYYEAVGAPCGMTRIGPGKRRLTREGWKAEQQQAEAIAAQHKRADELRADALQTAKDLKQRGDEYKAKVKAETQELKDKALREADEASQEIKDKALKEAGEIAATAEKSGFERGLTAFGALPWVQKASKFLSSVVKERDALLTERNTLKKTLEETVSAHRTFKQKARGWFDSAKELVLLKPQLEQAQGDVAHLKIETKKIAELEQKNSVLGSDLDNAKSHISDLKKIVAALSDTDTYDGGGGQEKAPVKGLDHDSDSLTLG